MTDSAALAEVLALEESGFGAGERWSRDSWQSELSEPSLEVLGWRDHRILSLSQGAVAASTAGSTDAELLGVIALRSGGETVDLDRLVVVPWARRRGIGRELITAGCRWAAERGATEMVLEVRTDNEPAVRLYRSLGFVEVIVRAGYYGPGADALVMSRSLEQA